MNEVEYARYHQRITERELADQLAAIRQAARRRQARMVRAAVKACRMGEYVPDPDTDCLVADVDSPLAFPVTSRP